MTANAADTPVRIVGVGPLPPPVGGTTVAFKLIQEALAQRSDASTVTVDTNGVRFGGMGGRLRLFPMLLQTYREARRADVIVLHCSTTALHIAAVLMVVVARLARRPLIIRKFGGSDYTVFPAWKRRLADFAVTHADRYLLETKYLVGLAEGRGLKHVSWFPNSRSVPEGGAALAGKGQAPCRRFVYFGLVEAGKGLREIIEADALLPGDIVVDVYGPMGKDIAESDFGACRRTKYHGTLQPERVIPTLADYDALILPTHHAGEGYPGAIIEAFAAGLPVICTKWVSLLELVDDGAGMLIEAKDTGALVEAMSRMAQDQELYARLCEGARRKRSDFSMARWTDWFVAQCRGLAAASNRPR